jgi:Methyltransferase domain
MTSHEQIEDNINSCVKYINDNLMPIINDVGETLEGHIFCDKLFRNKQRNISLLSTKYNNVLEIGFNSGFSAALMLISNPNLKLTCVDIGIHNYVIPCYEQLKKDFGDRITLHIGDSTRVLPELVNSSLKYDLIHIDGSHDVDIAEKDIVYTYRVSNVGTVIIMDDMNLEQYHYPLVQLWVKYLNIYNYAEVDFQLYSCRWHDVVVVK